MEPHPGVLRLTARYEDMLAGYITTSSRDTEQVNTSPVRSPEREIFETSQDWTQLDRLQDLDHDRFMESRVTDWQEKTFFGSQCDGAIAAAPTSGGHDGGDSVTNPDKLDWGGVFQKLRSASASSGSSATGPSGSEDDSPISSTTTASPATQITGRFRRPSTGASPTRKTGGARASLASSHKSPQRSSTTLPRSTCSAGDSTLKEASQVIMPTHVTQSHIDTTEHVAIKSSDTQADLKPDTTEQRISGRITKAAITNVLLDEIINSKTIMHGDAATLQKLTAAQAKLQDIEAAVRLEVDSEAAPCRVPYQNCAMYENKDGKWEPGLPIALLLFMVPWVLCIGVVKVLF